MRARTASVSCVEVNVPERTFAAASVTVRPVRSDEANSLVLDFAKLNWLTACATVAAAARAEKSRREICIPAPLVKRGGNETTCLVQPAPGALGSDRRLLPAA